MDLVERGAIAVRGNHDSAIGTSTVSMNAEAQAAIEWTRGRLRRRTRRFLADLPLMVQEDDRLYVHSEASNPERWHYVQDDTGCRAQHHGNGKPRSHFAATSTSRRFYSMSAAAKDDELVPRSGVGVQLLPGRRWLGRARLGGAASRRRSGGLVLRCSIPIPAKITYCRVPYDVETAAKRIRQNGLPFWLADRLLVGR